MHKSIEQCFEAWDSAKDYLTIERLELNLGVFDADQFLCKMPEKLYHELQKILRSGCIYLDDTKVAGIVEDVSSTTTGSAPETDERIKSLIVRNSEITAFLFFLQHGYLPWWYSTVPDWNLKWVQNLTKEQFLELQGFLEDCQENEFYYERILSRLISQFSDELLASLLEGLQVKEPVEKIWSWFTQICETMLKSETDSFIDKNSLSSFSILRRHFWKKWTEYALGRSAIPGLTTLLTPVNQTSLINSFLIGIVKRKEWMESIPEFWHNELLCLIDIKFKEKPGIGINAGLINYTESEQFKDTEKPNTINQNDFRHPEYNSKPDSNIKHEINTLTENKKFIVNEKADSIAEDDYILIPDAGLVLLNPFLPQLFENCNWLNENGFVNEEARIRAVYLLHYLAAGHEDAPEYVMMLPKLLCGIPPGWPPEPVLPLTEVEKAACDELLIQVIAHWAVLQNTSPAGLREAFLCREGMIFSKAEGWHLEVQRKTEDILLNRLPWGFSMIKLPWMPWLLSVTWE